LIPDLVIIRQNLLAFPQLQSGKTTHAEQNA